MKKINALLKGFNSWVEDQKAIVKERTKKEYYESYFDDRMDHMRTVVRNLRNECDLIECYLDDAPKAGYIKDPNKVYAEVLNINYALLREQDQLWHDTYHSSSRTSKKTMQDIVYKHRHRIGKLAERLAESEGSYVLHRIEGWNSMVNMFLKDSYRTTQFISRTADNMFDDMIYKF